MTKQDISEFSHQARLYEKTEELSAAKEEIEILGEMMKSQNLLVDYLESQLREAKQKLALLEGFSAS